MSIKNINSEKENIKNYQNTCSEFLKDLSLDYLNWAQASKHPRQIALL